MDNDFKITLEGTTLHVELDFELSTKNAPALQDGLKQYQDQDIQKVVFDATNLVYISSAGIRVIIFASQKLSRRPKIEFLNSAKEIYDTLDISGITNFISFVEDERKNGDTDVQGDDEWAQRMAEAKQKMLDKFAANNDVVMYQMRLGQDDD